MSPPHAVPNPRFGLSSVRERLYRGRCANNQHLDRSIQTWLDKKSAVFDLINNQEGLNNSERKRTDRYVKDFYRVIESKSRVDKRIVRACLGK